MNKKILFAVSFLFLLLVFTPASHAATFVSGVISTSTTWSAVNNPYIVEGVVSVDPNITLTINPGVIVKFNPITSLDIKGILNAQGTATNKIYFTSIRDDSIGGDTNGDNTTTIPAPRDWIGIYSGSIGNFNNVVIQYAGGGVCDICHGAGIFNSGTLNVSNSKISNNDKVGLFLFNGMATISSSEISYNNYGIQSFYYLSPNISQSSIHDNYLYGIFTQHAYVINAVNNWWGDASGPYHAELNPTGIGDKISNNVDFIPWLTSDPIQLAVTKEVPLYTQVRSDYPSDVSTAEWANSEYSKGFTENYNCGSTISQCGCALTSSVMVLRYYDLVNINNNDVNPGTLNNWLKGNNGYVGGGSVNWMKIAEYSGNKIKYDYVKSGDYLNNYALLDEYLYNNQPAITKEKTGRGGLNGNHFIVIDNKFTSTYSVKDPAWYNTLTLDETTDSPNKIRGYENGFDGLRLFYPSNGVAESSMSLTLGSPAELLVIDSLGRKLGKDPVSGNIYNEIPNGSYFSDSMDDPFSESIGLSHESKSIYIGNPASGNYDIRVIGTGSGDYSLDFLAYGNNGASYNKSFSGTTENGAQSGYGLNFTPDDPGSINIETEPVDEIPPEAKIYFDKDNKTLKVEGIDNISQNPTVERQGNNFTITDEAGNSLVVSFNELKEQKNWIRAILPNVSMYLGWGTDNKTGQITRLDQRIDAGNMFNIRAVYNKNKNITNIEINLGGQNTSEEISGLAIIKLIVKSDGLDFEIGN